MTQLDRRAYAEMFGPTTGDRIRLGDTELWIQIERDHAIYGEEVKFGGGKVIRDGMGQGQGVAAQVMDTVITNAVILDHWGVVKAHGYKYQHTSTAGWRKPVGEQYPQVDLIRRARQLGIPFTLASDAHSHAQLAEEYERLAGLLKQLGISEVAAYEKHQRRIIPIT